MAVTAWVTSDEGDFFRAAGFDGFVAKPVDLRAFARRIQAHGPLRMGEVEELRASTARLISRSSGSFWRRI